jgi:uncharacterized damage-inducible protein DinB
MSERMLWFERKFKFDLPAWMFPNVLERLRGTPVRVEERMRAFPREILNVRDGDAWSMQEHAGHLLDLEPLGFMRLEDYLARREVLRAADVENRKTHEARHNERSIEEILDALRGEREEFVRRLEEADEELVLREAMHPRLQKPMRLLDLLFFIAEHDDHHVAHMTRLGRKMSNERHAHGR